MCLIWRALSLNGRTKNLFTPWKVGSTKKYKHWFSLSIDTFDWYLFSLTALLKPAFKYSSSFTLSYNLPLEHNVLYLLSQVFLHLLNLQWQIDVQIKIRLISQLIKVISIVLQNLLKCFNGTAISTPFVLPPSGIFPVFFYLSIVIISCSTCCLLDCLGPHGSVQVLTLI